MFQLNIPFSRAQRFPFNPSITDTASELTDTTRPWVNQRLQERSKINRYLLLTKEDNVSPTGYTKDRATLVNSSNFRHSSAVLVNRSISMSRGAQLKPDSRCLSGDVINELNIIG